MLRPHQTRRRQYPVRLTVRIAILGLMTTNACHIDEELTTGPAAIISTRIRSGITGNWHDWDFGFVLRKLSRKNAVLREIVHNILQKLRCYGAGKHACSLPIMSSGSPPKWKLVKS